MKAYNEKNVFIFSKDLSLIEQLRRDLYSFNACIRLFLNNRELIGKHRVELIIIDQRFFKEFEYLPRFFHTKIIYISEDYSKNNIEKIIVNKADNILFTPINYTFLLCLIRKYLGLLITKECQELVYRGISLSNTSKSITYNRCKALLTDSEFETMKSIMSNSIDSRKSSAALQVTVCRINKKSVEAMGLRLIKKRRGHNYIISI